MNTQWIECGDGLRIVISDAEDYKSLLSKAEMNEDAITEKAEALFSEYIKDTGVQLEFRINGVDRLIGRSAVEQINYRERTFDPPINIALKEHIADEIGSFVKDKYKHYNKDCQVAFNALYKNEIKKREKRTNLFIVLWLVTFLLLLIGLFTKLI